MYSHIAVAGRYIIIIIMRILYYIVYIVQRPYDSTDGYAKMLTVTVVMSAYNSRRMFSNEFL